MRRLRVLISAYACSPYRGSEYAVGWNVATRLAQYHDVTVLCGDVAAHQPNKQDLDRYFRENPAIEGLTIRYVPPTASIGRYERIHRIPGLWTVYYRAYKLWQREAYRQAVEMHQRQPFDIAHHLNMIGYREPGYLWKLPIPFVWGPIGGAANEPWSFLTTFGIGGMTRVGVRNLLNLWQMRFARRARLAARRAAKLWTVTAADHEMATRLWGIPAEPMLETGANPAPDSQVRRREPGEPLRLIWSGLHIPRKALPIALHAIACLPEPQAVRLTVLGSGPETGRWRALADRLGLSSLIVWKGQLPRDQALDEMRNAHACIFPSIKEGTPHVVLESLSLGLPVICHDACGMGTAVNDTCGIKFPLRCPEDSIRDTPAALRRLLDEPSLLDELSAGCLRRAQELSWDAKVRVYAEQYVELAKAIPAAEVA